MLEVVVLLRHPPATKLFLSMMVTGRLGRYPWVATASRGWTAPVVHTDCSFNQSILVDGKAELSLFLEHRPPPPTHPL